MIAERWTDEATRAISIDLNTYNPNYDMATVMRFKIDIVGGGHFFPKVETLSCRLNPYSNMMDYVRLIGEITFVGLLVYYIWQEVMELRASGPKVYLTSFWNII